MVDLERERERERTKSEKGWLKGIDGDDDQRSSGDNGSLRPLVTMSLTSKHAKIRNRPLIEFARLVANDEWSQIWVVLSLVGALFGLAWASVREGEKGPK